MNLLSCRLLAALILFAGLAMVQGKAHAETNATCAGFINSLPATISTQGVWCLRSDLGTAITSGNAITVATNNVTIDCNDFKIGGLAAGNDSLAIGIRAAGKQNTTVRNCSIRGFQFGISLSGAGHLVEDNRFDHNLHTGIHVIGDNNMVQRNRVHDTGAPSDNASVYAYGIYASAHVIDNIVAGVAPVATNANPRGIAFGSVGAVASGNLVSGLQTSGSGEAIGIQALSPATRIENNHAVASNWGTNGSGIVGYTTALTACDNNVVSRFSTPMIDCLDHWGNASL